MVEKVDFINMIVKKTKANNLKWKRYMDSNVKLNPEKTDFEGALGSAALHSMIITDPTTLEDEKSYWAGYNGGFIFLLYYVNPMILNGYAKIVLSIQTSKNGYSKPYISTIDDDATCVSKLKRLYTLVEETNDEFETFIDDFMSS